MKVSDLCTYAPKSSIKAGDAVPDGAYVFFTSSSDENKRYSDYQLDCEGIIMGTGGNATLHYYNGKFATSTDCVVLLPNETIRCKYLYYFFLCNIAVLEAGFKGAGLKHTNKNYINSIELSNVPSLEEQDKVIEVLDKVRAVVSGRITELSKLDELIKARFVELFGDLANPDCEWNSIKLVDACANPDDIKCGPFGTQLSKDEYTDSGVAVWEIPQINSAFKTAPIHYLTEEKAEQLSAYSLVSGDIAMSRKGNVGKCALFPYGYADGIIHSDVLRIRVEKKNVNPVFMMCQLHFSGAVTRQIELVSSGAIMAGVNVTKLKQIYVHIPPKKLQDQFAEFVKQVDKSKVVVQKALDGAQLLFDSLMQKYFG